MTIRKRLTIWYVSLMLVSIFLMAGAMYYELIIEHRAMIAAGKPSEPIEEEMAEVIFFYALPTALVTVLGGWFLLHTALAPLDRLTRAAERIQLENLRQPLPGGHHGDEVDRLSEVLNAMTARLDEAFARVRDFTLNASHELKTPLTIMRAELESVLRDNSCEPAQRELYANQLEEIQRLTKIVNGLTLLCKADAGQLTLNMVPVHLDELVRDSFADAQMLADPRQVRVELIACDPIVTQADPHRLRQMLLNLTDNAIKYNETDGHVTLALTRRNGDAEFAISNSGPGIPPEKLPRVFDRFFRGDTSHSSQVEGCGLGLPIAQRIVQAHQGTIRLESDPSTRTTVVVQLPIREAPSS